MITYIQKFILAIMVAVFVLPGSMAMSAQERPNILFIMADDHAIRALSAYGSSLVETPNIDRIAKNGLRFDRAYVGNAICGPSRATTLTGLHSHANGFYSNEWSPDFNGHQQTFPRLLHAAGYKTAVVGKWHLYSDPVGFDYWDVINNGFEHGTYYNAEFRSPAGLEKTDGYVAEFITDKAITWLDSLRDSDQPFMLMLQHKTPHRDWMPAPQELNDWVEDEQVEEPATLLRDLSGQIQSRQEARMTIAKHMGDQDVKLSKAKYLTPEQGKLWEQAFGEGNRKFRSAHLSSDEETRWKYQRYVKTYMASVKGLDREIGRMLDYLETNELMDNTLIVYTSDQGFFLGENGWFDKRWMDEVSSKVPLLMQWPGKIQPGTTTSALVQNIDYAPTLLDAAGVKLEKPMHGVSLLPLLGNKPVEWHRDLYYHFYENPGFHGVARHYGIRTERYKLIHYYRSNEWELYDLVEDPQDQLNLYGKAGYENIEKDLKTQLNALRLEYNVPADDQDPSAPWYHDTLVRLLEWWYR